jgi:hypothetical protein
MFVCTMDDDILDISELCGFHVEGIIKTRKVEDINQVRAHIPFEPISQHRRPSSTSAQQCVADKIQKTPLSFHSFHSISRHQIIS